MLLLEVIYSKSKKMDYRIAVISKKGRKKNMELLLIGLRL